MAIQEKFPSIKPSLNLDFANTKTLDPRVTFSRASAATYYDGKTVAKAEENLFPRSEEFDNTAVWNGYGTLTRTANATSAPNATSTADRITDTVETVSHGMFQSVPFLSNTPYVFSVYAKNDGRRYFALTLSGATSNYAYAEFDLVNGSVSRSGAVGTGFAVNSATTENVGDGWFRCVLIGTVGTTVSTPRQRITLSNGTVNVDLNASFNYAGDATSIFLWGAQLEQRSQATAYTATTDQPITNYVPVLQTAPANVARFDHNPVTGESLGLLIEEQRTNLLRYSEDFGNVVWTKTNATVTANAVVAPDGTLTADKAIATAVSGEHFVRQVPTTSDSTTYAATVFAKAAELTWARLIFLRKDSNRVWVNVNLSTGELGNASASFPPTATPTVTPAGNGFYRISVVANSVTGGAGAGMFIYLLDSNSTADTYQFTGDGYSGIYIWGAQLEVGAFPTSYIKTEASQVTRAADSAVMTGSNFSSWFRQDEGTLFSSATRGWSSNPFQNRLFVLDDGSSANRIQIRVLGDGSITGTVSSSSTAQADLSSGSARLFSAALAYKYNDFAFVSNGGNVASDTSGVVPNGIARASIAGPAIDSPFSGHIRKIAYYPKRLTNTQLQAITT